MEESQEQTYPNNVLLFRLAISNSFKCIAESVSQEDFQNILTILKSKPTVVQKLHKTMFTELFETMNSDLNDILNEGNLRNEMEKVAKLSDADSSITEDAWRPPGNVSLHLRSLDAHYIKEESKLLESRINDMEEENAVLMQKIADKRSKIIAMNDSITRSLIHICNVRTTTRIRMSNQYGRRRAKAFPRKPKPFSCWPRADEWGTSYSPAA